MPAVLCEHVQRGVVHAGKQCGFGRIVLVVAHRYLPGLLGTGTQFVAHGGEFYVKQVVVERYIYVFCFCDVGVFFHQSHLPFHCATVLFFNGVGDCLNAVVEGYFLFEAHILSVHQPHQNFHVVGGAADV